MLYNKNIKEYYNYLIKTYRPIHKEIYTKYNKGETILNLSENYKYSIPFVQLIIRRQNDLKELKELL
ncbi:hypothetical protein [Priestia aryabhattai]|uniref:hypothetical protein n=1 Tax=Priestia aryabhattai TaxID=412384 RepID=UPI0015F781F6|nr:hypothetical protein [Priestia aryabhattai]